MRTIAREIYGAEDIIADQRVRDQFKDYRQARLRTSPICVAKTQYSFSTDPNLKGHPRAMSYRSASCAWPAVPNSWS